MSRNDLISLTSILKHLDCSSFEYHILSVIVNPPNSKEEEGGGIKKYKYSKSFSELSARICDLPFPPRVCVIILEYTLFFFLTSVGPFRAHCHAILSRLSNVSFPFPNGFCFPWWPQRYPAQHSSDRYRSSPSLVLNLYKKNAFQNSPGVSKA